MAERSAETFLPLPGSTFLILAALAHRPQHGYSISKFIEDCSEGTLRIAIGNLYVSLKRLQDQGLIQLDPTVPDDSGRNRKTYRLTCLGSNVLNLEAQRLAMLQRALAIGRTVQQGATK